MKTIKGSQLSAESQNSQVENVDISLIEYNLSLTPEERLLNHQRALDTINELIKAREQLYGGSESPVKTSS